RTMRDECHSHGFLRQWQQDGEASRDVIRGAYSNAAVHPLYFNAVRWRERVAKALAVLDGEGEGESRVVAGGVRGRTGPPDRRFGSAVPGPGCVAKVQRVSRSRQHQ